MIPPTMKVMDNNIAIDISESMLIEDCEPTRIEMVKKGVDKFLERRNSCNFGIILFAASAWKYSEPAAGKCYSTAKILPPGGEAGGTAIGEAVFLAANQGGPTSQVRRLILISDGDNTIGSVSPALAAEIALNHNLTISCIGVGQEGPVKFGKDALGRSVFVSDTFSDTSLKFLASKTNGHYYRAKNSEEVAKILWDLLN